MEIENLNSFEHFSLRAARALLVATIALGCLAIAVGLLIAAGAWVIPAPAKPAPPSPPVATTLMLDDAEKWSAEHASDLADFDRSALALEDPGEVPPTLASLFPDPPHAKKDVWEDFCRVPSDYGCLQHGKRIKTASAARTFTAFLRGINERRQTELIAVLKEQLPSVGVDRRLRLVIPILMASIETEKRNRQAQKDYQAKLKDADEQYAAEVAEHNVKKSAWSMGGVWGAVWGFGTVISASVFVALLAIERHLRELRRQREAATSQIGKAS